VNHGVFDAKGDWHIRLVQQQSSGTFVNDGGTFVKSGGAGVTNIDVNFSNILGLLDVNGRQISLGMGISQNSGRTRLGGGTLAVTGSFSQTNGSETLLGAGAVLTVSEGLTQSDSDILLSGGNLTVSGTFSQNGGSNTLLQGGNLTAAQVVVHAGKIILGDGTLAAVAGVEIKSSGTLWGSGTIAGNLTSSGSIYVGDSPQIGVGGGVGLITIEGHFTQALTGALYVHVGAGVNDRLFVVGTVEISGSLDVSLVAGYNPQANDSFRIVEAGEQVQGEFTTTDFPALGGGLTWDDPLFDISDPYSAIILRIS
jgi:fibronectin-binding autotransporter adhesin